MTLNNFEFVVTIMYFTFTSLSTVGFGDYYPITDIERIYSSFILMFGVATFSYTMGQLTNVLYTTLYNFEKRDSSNLDQFFNLLKYLNKSEPIEKQ